MSSTVVAKLRPADETSVIGLRDYQSKLALAIEYTVERLEIGAQEVTIIEAGASRARALALALLASSTPDAAISE